jgi:hypothetical protein
MSCTDRFGAMRELPTPEVVAFRADEEWSQFTQLYLVTIEDNTQAILKEG